MYKQMNEYVKINVLAILSQRVNSLRLRDLYVSKLDHHWIR